MPAKRTKRGRKGDCLPQCLARVMGRKPASVPHFCEKYRGRWVYHLFRWLRRVGWQGVLCANNARSPLLVCPGIPMWIEIGPGSIPRKRRQDHAVVCGDDGKGIARHVYDGGNPLKRTTRSLVIWKARR